MRLNSSGTGHFKRVRFAPYLFMAPFILFFAVFGLYPIVKSVLLSFYITNGPKDHVFVGLGNYRFLLSDPDFFTAARNTIVFAIGSIVFQLPLALGLAMLLNNPKLRGRNLLKLAFFSPHLVGQVFVAVLFMVLFIPQFGMVNRAAHFVAPRFPLEFRWLGDPSLVMPALILASLWMYVGFHMIYFLAALQAVDSELMEAAWIDGAGSASRFFAVTLPAIKPVFIFVLVSATIGSFQLFELPWILLNQTPGPDKAGLTVVMHMYRQGFQTGDLGYASAIGWTLALAVLIVSLIQMKLTGGWRTEV